MADQSPDDPWQQVRHHVVLMNFGGPERPEDVQPFLQKLFEDPFIIRAPIGAGLRGLLARRIARKRAPKALAEYQAIGFSPINRYTLIQAAHLEALLRVRRPLTTVHVVNRYSAPFAADVVRKIEPSGSRIFMLALYPHLCHSTTVSSIRDFDQAWDKIYGPDSKHAIRIFSWWHNRAFLDLTVRQLTDCLSKVYAHHSSGPVTVLFSAHGLPRRYNERGDPYVIETRNHVDALSALARHWLQKNGLDSSRVHFELTFQSRVGPMEWVRPYTDESVIRIGRERGGTLVVVPVSFISDHIETLYEIDHTLRDSALASGFEAFFRVTPANDDPALAGCLADILRGYGF